MSRCELPSLGLNPCFPAGFIRKFKDSLLDTPELAFEKLPDGASKSNETGRTAAAEGIRRGSVKCGQHNRLTNICAITLFLLHPEIRSIRKGH